MRGELEAAEREFKSALKIDGALLHARLNLAKVFIQGGNKRAAADELQAVLSVDPDNTEARRLLSTLRQ